MRRTSRIKEASERRAGPGGTRAQHSGFMMIGWLLKRDTARDIDIVFDVNLGEDDARARIRCPLCGWQPDKRSRWSCVRTPSPEGFFGGCGTVWDTFSTRGRCPGCQHQWRWTSCLRCGGWSLHEDWYEEQRDGLS